MNTFNWIMYAFCVLSIVLMMFTGILILHFATVPLLILYTFFIIGLGREKNSQGYPE